MGSSEELFSDHAAIESGEEGTASGSSGAFFGKSSPSTPSFADEKEVFDVLRQASLEWEVSVELFSVLKFFKLKTYIYRSF